MRKDEFEKITNHIKTSVMKAPNMLTLSYQIKYFTEVCYTLHACRIINDLQFASLFKSILDNGSDTEERLLKAIQTMEGNL